MRYLETVSRKWEVAITMITKRFPTTADKEINQTGTLNTQFPIRSSQGLKASGAGWHSTLKKCL